jgi:hypothetical protein
MILRGETKCMRNIKRRTLNLQRKEHRGHYMTGTRDKELQPELNIQSRASSILKASHRRIINFTCDFLMYVQPILVWNMVSSVLVALTYFGTTKC